MTSERTAAHLRNFVTKKTAQSTKAPSILQATVEMPRDSIKLPATRHSATHCPIHLPQGCLPATHPQKMTCKGWSSNDVKKNSAVDSTVSRHQRKNAKEPNLSWCNASSKSWKFKVLLRSLAISCFQLWSTKEKIHSRSSPTPHHRKHTENLDVLINHVPLANLLLKHVSAWQFSCRWKSMTNVEARGSWNFFLVSLLQEDTWASQWLLVFCSSG